MNAHIDGVITTVARATGGHGAYLSRELGQPRRLMIALAFTTGVPRDFDDDGNVDLRDFGGFRIRFTGTDGGPIDLGCEPGDFEGDESITGRRLCSPSPVPARFPSLSR